MLCFYLLLLQTLPSVRAMKMFVNQECQTTCHNAEESNSGCEKGKVIMNLNFNPTQFVAEISLKETILIPDFYTEKEKSNYEKFLSQIINILSGIHLNFHLRNLNSLFMVFF